MERLKGYVGKPLLSEPARRLARLWAVNVAIAAVFFMFAKAHLAVWLDTGDARGLGVVAIETVVAVLILVRRSPIETSGRPVAWVATAVGMIGPMFLRPTSGGWGSAVFVQLAGAGLALVSLLVIGRSFGLVAANRGIVTRGPYGRVRHPIYLGYLVANVGYLAENPSSRNITVIAVATLAQLVRIACEEEILARDSAYQEYRRAVRYRLVPYVY